MKLTSNIRYADNHLADIYEPLTPSKGAIMLLHTSWLGGDKQDTKAAAELLVRCGYTAFAPNYRLPPHSLFSESRGDVLIALNWLNGSNFAFDRSRVAVWGFSAGGTLAAEIALSEGVPAVTWSGLFDLLAFMQETALLADKDYDFAMEGLTPSMIEHGGQNDRLLRNLILQLVSNNTSWLASATPLSRVTEASGPIMMINGVIELVPPEGAMVMQKELSAVGVSSIVNLLPGKAHGCGNLLAAFDEALQFLVRHFEAGSDNSTMKNAAA